MGGVGKELASLQQSPLTKPATSWLLSLCSVFLHLAFFAKAFDGMGGRKRGQPALFTR